MDSFLHQKHDKPTSPPTTTTTNASPAAAGDYKKHHQKPSNSELLSSAKLVAEAAKSSFSHDPKAEKYDKGKVAGAAADLLNAASNYGKLDQKGFGKYLDKAEDYLHKYETTHTTTTTTTTTTGHGGHSATEKVETTTTTTHSTGHSGREEHKSGGGYGDYIKMAEGFLKTH